jgi:hypothetical protein
MKKINWAMLVHDSGVYGASFLTLWGSHLTAGSGWDSMIAAAPVAASQVIRNIVKQAAS